VDDGEAGDDHVAHKHRHVVGVVIGAVIDIAIAFGGVDPAGLLTSWYDAIWNECGLDYGTEYPRHSEVA
jgi:hypothetical protein